MTAFHQAIGGEEQRRAERHRLQRYGVDKKDLKRLQSTLVALEAFDLAIATAMADMGSPLGADMLKDVRLGLRVLLGLKRLHVSAECLVHGCICAGAAP